MRISKRFLSLLLSLCLLAAAIPATGLAVSSDSSTPTAADSEAQSEDTDSSANNPTTDEEIMAALETYDSSIDDPQYQKAYDAYQERQKTDGNAMLQTLSTVSNPYTGKTYTHTHAKTSYIYDGIDVSKWQSTIDWKKVKADGVDFVFIRCGYTSLDRFSMGTDAKFAANIQNAYAAGIKIGVYYYSGATSASEAKTEANYVLNLIRPYKSKISLPVVMDYETNGSDRIYTSYQKTSKATRTTYVQSFCDILEDAGYDGGIYASKAWLTDFFNMSDLKDYACWVAHVTTKTSYAGEYDFWQYSFTGDINGISTDVDCNFWYTDDKLSTSSASDTTLSSSNTTVKLSYTTIPYSGSARKPTPKVTYNGTTLTKGTHYTVSYSNNKEPGTATVKITGTGKYKGTLSKTFTITALTTPYVTICKTYYRTGCGTSYTSKGSVSKGKPVNVVYGWYKTVSGKKWYKVKIGSSYYYMYGPNLIHEVLVKYATTVNLNYRSGAGTSYAVKGTFAKGNSIQVVKGWNKTVSGDKWYKAKVGSSYYYSIAKYLSKQEPLSLYSVKSTVNVRSAAGTSNTRKASLYAGTPVAVVSGGTKIVSGDKWYRVKINTSYYYIMASYLKKN